MSRSISSCLPLTEAKKVRKENEDRKAAIVDALQRKCKALLELEDKKATPVPGENAAEKTSEAPQAGGETGEGTDEFKQAFAELRKWWVWGL